MLWLLGGRIHTASGRYPGLMLQHVEPLVDAAIASLRAGLNDVIDVINVEHADFELPYVGLDSYRAGGLAKASTVYPFVEVVASDSILSLPSNMQVAYDRSETTMICAAWCRHVDDEVLYRSAMRYGQAVLQVLSTNDAFGTNARVERARASYRRNPETRQSEQLVAGVVIVVQVIVDDESPL